MFTPEQLPDRRKTPGSPARPVYRGALDDIIGILLYKDLSRGVRRGGPIKVEKIIRPPVFLPDTMKLNEALRTLRRTRDHLALVVDEHAGVEGLATLEDLLEE